MKTQVVHSLKNVVDLSFEKLNELVEVPKESGHGDYAFPCFVLAKSLKKNPVVIAKELAERIKLPKELEKAEAVGPYLNFFVNTSLLAQTLLLKVLKEKDKYGSSDVGKGTTTVIDMSSPNIAKPFGIGHLRSTIIGNSIAQILKFRGFKVVKLNYLGDWGTPFGKIIAGYKEFGNPSLLKKNPIKHLFDVYVKASADERFEKLGREWFKKMELGDKEAIKLWKTFKELSVKEFSRIYSLLGVEFDVMSGESEYNGKMSSTLEELKKKNLLEESEGAEIVNLDKYGLGVCLIKKSDGATLYATRDITAALDRHIRYKSNQLIYEVGIEQKLYFQQLFKILELLGHGWAKNCKHVEHGLYLDEDGKRFRTRKGKTVFMEDILDETRELAKKETKKRGKLSEKELDSRALAIARAAIFYGDLKNYRGHDMVFDIDRFVSFEGDTGPYLLYSYARAKSILKKAKYKRSVKLEIGKINDGERALIVALRAFPRVVESAGGEFAPNLVAHYAYTLAQTFNEFYHNNPVIGDEQENFRLTLVDAFSQVLKNALALLGIPVLEEM